MVADQKCKQEPEAKTSLNSFLNSQREGAMQVEIQWQGFRERCRADTEARWGWAWQVSDRESFSWRTGRSRLDDQTRTNTFSQMSTELAVVSLPRWRLSHLAVSGRLSLSLMKRRLIGRWGLGGKVIRQVRGKPCDTHSERDRQKHKWSGKLQEKKNWERRRRTASTWQLQAVKCFLYGWDV